MDENKVQPGADPSPAQIENPTPEPTKPEKVDEPKTPTPIDPTPPKAPDADGGGKEIDPPPADPPTQVNPPPKEPNETETLKAQVASMRTQLTQAKAQGILAELGVSADRMPYVLRLADLGSIDAATEAGSAAMKAAMEKVLTDVPELRGGGTGGPMGHPRNPPSAANTIADGFRAALRR